MVSFCRYSRNLSLDGELFEKVQNGGVFEELFMIGR
jgi:hypothetical protein